MSKIITSDPRYAPDTVFESAFPHFFYSSYICRRMITAIIMFDAYYLFVKLI
eukprot:UN21285